MKRAIGLLLTLSIALSQTSYSQQIRLFSFSGSTCDTELDPSRLRTRIINKEFKDGIFTIHIADVATCCVTFSPIYSYVNDTLNLGFNETGSPCECGCCYEFTYQIAGLKHSDVKVKFRGKTIEHSIERFNTYPIQFEILNGDTVDRVDKYGLRQGKWNVRSESDKEMSYSIMMDDRTVERVKLYSNNKIKSRGVADKIRFTADGREYFEYGDLNKYFEYYPNGAKKKECLNNTNSSMNSYWDGTCTEWNEKGEITYQGKFRKN